MNLRLPAILAILALSPIALSAQTATASPVLYAASAAPASSSSSLVPHALFAAAGAPSAAASSKGSSLPFSGLAIGVKVGLGGFGFDVATPLVPQRLNLRGGASFFDYTPSTITTDSLNINGNIKFQNAAAMVDWFPFHGSFRLSGGATIYNDTGLTATLSVPTGQSFTVGNTTYYSEPYNAVTNPNGPIQGNGVFTFGGNNVVPRTTSASATCCPRRVTSASRPRWRPVLLRAHRAIHLLRHRLPELQLNHQRIQQLWTDLIVRRPQRAEQTAERPLRLKILPHPLLRLQLQDPLTPG